MGVPPEFCPHNSMGRYFRDVPWWHTWPVHTHMVVAFISGCFEVEGKLRDEDKAI